MEYRDPGDSREPGAPDPIVVDGSLEWEVERILRHRHVGCGKQLQYLVHWKHYNLSDASWEPMSGLSNAP